MQNEIEWFKFLGLRYWGYKENNFYILPKNIKFNIPEIESAYTMVLKNNVKNIDSLFENEEFKENIFNIYFIEGIEKGKEEGIKEGIEK